jgi:hypothetical protein
MEISLAARLPDRMPKSEVLELAKSAFAIGYQRGEGAHWQNRAEYSARRIQLGQGSRQITAFVFDAPYPFIEIHSEPGVGALTAAEAGIFSAWLSHRALEMQAQKSKGWLRRLLRLGRQPAPVIGPEPQVPRSSPPRCGV